MANLSQDENKLALFIENLDGHCLSACYYYKERVEELVGPFTDYKQAAKDLAVIVSGGCKIAKEVRQDAKPCNFSLVYGAYPDKVASTVGVNLEEAQQIFDMFHYELFPGITKYREEYILPTVLANGELHMGLGATLKSDDPNRHIRTLANASKIMLVMNAKNGA